MDNNRPTISADLKRRILVEAGYRCAIPTCRHIDTEIHHIVPWEKCKKHEYDNLIALCPNCHKRADEEEIDRKSLRLYKENLRFIHDKFSQLEVDTLFELYKCNIKNKGTNISSALPFPPYSQIFLKRIVDANYIQIIISETTNVRCEISGSPVRILPDFVYITEDGKKFIEELQLEKL